MTRKPLTRQQYFVFSLAVSAATGLLAFWLAPKFTLDALALGLFVTYLACALWNLPLLTADYLRRHARQEDMPVTIMFAVVLLVLGTCIGSLFQLINEGKDPEPLRLVVAFSSVAFAWFTLHTMYAFHYAHICWLNDGVSDASNDEAPRKEAGGLDFPGDKEPGGLDFVYFSFVIGMTAQTADVDTTTTKLRRVVIVHSILSYLFNTVIVAATVNLAVSLGNN